MYLDKSSSGGTAFYEGIPDEDEHVKEPKREYDAQGDAMGPCDFDMYSQPGTVLHFETLKASIIAQCDADGNMHGGFDSDQDKSSSAGIEFGSDDDALHIGN